MRFERVDTLSTLQGLESEWQALFDRRQHAHVVSSYPFVFASASTRFAQKPWRVYLARNGQSLEAAAFGVRTLIRLGRFTVPAIRMGTEFLADAIDGPSGDGQLLCALVETIFDEEDVPIVDFGRLTGPAFAALRPSLTSRKLRSTWNHEGYGHISDATLDRDEMYAQLSHDRRGNIRRKSRRLCEAFKIRFEKFSGRDTSENLAWLNQFVDLEASGWKGREKTAIRCRPAYHEYLRSLVEIGARMGMMRWYRLMADDQVIAMELGLHAGHAFWPPKTAYDERFANYSPGVELVHRLYLDCIDDPDIHCINWISAAPAQDAWRPDRLRYYHLRVFGRSARGRALYAAGALQDGLRRHIFDRNMDAKDRERRFL